MIPSDGELDTAVEPKIPLKINCQKKQNQNNNDHFICQKKEIELITALKNNLDRQKTTQNSNKLNELSGGKKDLKCYDWVVHVDIYIYNI